MGAIASNPNLYCIPTQVNFGNIRPGQTKERLLQVRRYDRTPVKSFKVTSSDKALQYTVESKATPMGVNPTIRIRLVAEDLPVGAYAATLVVRTEHDESPDLVVPVAAQVAEETEAPVKMSSE